MKGFPDLPPLWLVLALVLNWALARLWPGIFVGDVTRALSWGLIGLGIVLIGWAAFWFWRMRTPIEPHHVPRALLVEGPFRWSRNPIYLAMVVILLGSIIGRGQPLSLVILVLFIWVLHSRFILPEEEQLRQSFGAQADHYIRKTRRWL